MKPSGASSVRTNVFLDANILLEILLDRPQQQCARLILQQSAGSLHISALTAHLVTHFGIAIVSLPVLRKFLHDYTILSLESADFDWAFANCRSTDFEDALQLAVGIRCGCDTFITLDKELFTTYQGLPNIKVKLA